MTAAPAPHALFSVWSPDEVAECLEGVPPDVGRRLWGLARHYAGRPRSEVPDDFGERCLSLWWGELPEGDRALLNSLAERQDAGAGKGGKA